MARIYGGRCSERKSSRDLQRVPHNSLAVHKEILRPGKEPAKRRRQTDTGPRIKFPPARVGRNPNAGHQIEFTERYRLRNGAKLA